MNNLACYLLLGVLPEAIIYVAFLVVTTEGAKSMRKKAILFVSVYLSMLFTQKFIVVHTNLLIATIATALLVWYAYQRYQDNKPFKPIDMLLVVLIIGLHITTDCIFALGYGAEALAKAFAESQLNYYCKVALPERAVLFTIAVFIGTYRRVWISLYGKLLRNWRKN